MVGVGPSQAARRLPNPDTPDRVALTELRQCRIIADMDGGPVAVVETREFVRQASLIFSADETEALTTFIAYNPAAGVGMPGTGGVRKLRWARSGKGKRGGARVIYYFHSRSLPVFLVTAYAKARRGDVTQADRNSFRRLVDVLVGTYGTRG